MNALTHSKAKIVQDDFEVDRLDRLRNPSKYLGK
jgi:hypothetical protein